MFTGLVETVGTLNAIDRTQGENTLSSTAVASCLLTISNDEIFENASIGDSIAINGCCLTIVAMDHRLAKFEAGEETLSRTNLGELSTGDHVNLERAMKAGDRLGGHIVTGHVDGLGRIGDRKDSGEWSEFKVIVKPHLTKQMASKGSVTIDGTSLTLVDVGDDFFTVALIPHTLENTTLGIRNVGDAVNIETDILAKYVERQLIAAGTITE